jgi:hypothetical protein
MSICVSFGCTDCAAMHIVSLAHHPATCRVSIPRAAGSSAAGSVSSSWMQTLLGKLQRHGYPWALAVLNAANCSFWGRWRPMYVAHVAADGLVRILAGGAGSNALTAAAGIYLMALCVPRHLCCTCTCTQAAMLACTAVSHIAGIAGIKARPATGMAAAIPSWFVWHAVHARALEVSMVAGSTPYTLKVLHLPSRVPCMG